MVLYKKHYVVISVDAEKAFLNTVIKSFSKLGKERNFLNIVKNIYKELTANIVLNGERLNARCLPKIWKKKNRFENSVAAMGKKKIKKELPYDPAAILSIYSKEL